ncbi:hypothetical protein vseg_021477 [Gypsophila vaccaria]
MNRNIASTSQPKLSGKRSFPSRTSTKMRQSSILELFQPVGNSKKRRVDNDVESDITTSRVESENSIGGHVAEGERCIDQAFGPGRALESPELYNRVNCIDLTDDMEIESNWVQKADRLLQKHFGYSGLKSFQKEVISAWLSNQDCLVLAATGSGKSLCFQVPALLTGKVVVVISPLISLMHDQCLKLAKHGVSACFLGSGQPDSTVEKKAMDGMYSVVYVCPETVLRLIKPLQRLAENRGIALFAIDEVHCVSKWGHDFRPDYRRLSVLRKNFSASSLQFLKYDIPIMALTATATVSIRDDILKALHMSTNAKVVLTTFFRPNLQFSTKHSRTSSLKSYVKDFQELVQVYTSKTTTIGQRNHVRTVTAHMEDASEYTSSTTTESCDSAGFEDSEEDDDVSSHKGSCFTASKEKQLSVEFLEDDYDDIQTADDFDVSCGEFCAQSLVNDYKHNNSTGLRNLCPKGIERTEVGCSTLEQGPTIIYVPTRKQTISVVKYLSAKGVKASAYHAALPKSHLRQVHKDFHEDALDVVVATIAFGMGIDKLNVRRIIHYGWPQSLEAYYQEAGRAGRDGKLADCILYANLSRCPTLLPNKRNDEQKKQAYNMLSDCFRYGMNTSMCRAKILVEYFGEYFREERCMSCDVCRNGPPELQNVKEEADIFLEVIAAHYKQQNFAENSYDDYFGCDSRQYSSNQKPNLRTYVSKIREQSLKFLATDQLWWRGLARILQNKGFIREGSDMNGVQIKCPEITEQGLKFLESKVESGLYVYPEADMLLSTDPVEKPFSSFSWGSGWADPEIRRERLGKRKAGRKPRKSRKQRYRRKPDLKTVRGRLTAKLSKQKR